MLSDFMNAIVQLYICVYLCVFLHHTTGCLLYLMMRVTCDRWCTLVLPRTMCLTSRSHRLTWGTAHSTSWAGTSTPTTTAIDHRAAVVHQERADEDAGGE
jgi:hypothetical protein